MVSNEGFPEQASNWVVFQNQIKGNKPRHCTTWVDVNRVLVDQGGGGGGGGGGDGEMCSRWACLMS